MEDERPKTKDDMRGSNWIATGFRPAVQAPASYTAPMFCRWLIRGLALMLLTLCVGAWVGSYWRAIGIAYSGTERCLVLDEGNGKAVFGVEFLPPGVPLWPGWHFLRKVYLDAGYDNSPYHLMGFAFQKRVDSTIIGRTSVWWVWVPLYFPTLLSALLLWFVWRKTRAKPIGGRRKWNSFGVPWRWGAFSGGGARPGVPGLAVPPAGCIAFSDETKPLPTAQLSRFPRGHTVAVACRVTELMGIMGRMRGMG